MFLNNEERSLSVWEGKTETIPCNLVVLTFGPFESMLCVLIPKLTLIERFRSSAAFALISEEVVWGTILLEN